MTILTSIILIVAIVAIAAIIAYNVQRGTKTLQQFRDDYYDNGEFQQVAELAKDLYNKDARPTAPKKTPKKDKVVEVPEGIVEEPVKKEPKPEFPIDKPKKKKKFYPKAPKGKA